MSAILILRTGRSSNKCQSLKYNNYAKINKTKKILIFAYQQLPLTVVNVTHNAKHKN